MQGMSRRLLQAGLYELGAVGFMTPLLAWWGEADNLSSGALALCMSLIALGWNLLFNRLFEGWERRQVVRTRGWRRRLLHALGFEGGLTLLLVPLMAAWLGISLGAALVAEAGLLLLFFVYALGFQWAFDRLFGLPRALTQPRAG